MHRSSLLAQQDDSQSEAAAMASVSSSASEEPDGLEGKMLRLTHQISQMDQQLGKLDLCTLRSRMQLRRAEGPRRRKEKDVSPAGFLSEQSDLP
eukprot:767631-Hanusia_phi.AAC.6